MKKINEKFLNIILEEIKLNPSVTEKYFANKYNYSERTIRRYIRILKDNKKIELIGIGKGKYWKLL